MPSFLISRLSALGDVVCSLPAAGALKAGHPGCRVVWVCDPRFAALPRLCRHVDEVVEAKPQLNPKSWPVFGEEFEAALDLQGLAKSAIVVARARARRKLGYHWQREGSWLASQAVLPDPSSTHIVDQYVDVARAAGGSAHQADFGLRPAEKDLDSVRSKLAVGDPFVVLNPGAAWATKRWPSERCGRLIDLLALQGLRTVLIGGRAESDHASARAALEATRSGAANLCGQTSLGELVALLSLAKAHVGGDTGSTHLAAALGVPAIGLYSITRPQRSCPYGQIHRCLYEPEGLDRIAPEAVADKVLEALA
ncbi:MAG: glycosyltransferase family 9 protein [Fimbriimonadales bacterium]|nr:glycosyltransferase family 9 protein [Fimbriimonadales bacterium]